MENGKRPQQLSRRLLYFLLCASLLLNIILFSTPFFAQSSRSQKLQYTLQYLLHYMQNYYIDPVQEERLWEGAVRGLLGAAGDPYTRYLSPGEFSQYLALEDGRRVGLGLEVGLRKEAGKFPFVIAPIPGGPAAKAGILAGDRIITVNDKGTENISMPALRLLVSGKKNSRVKLGIERAGAPEPLSFHIKRQLFDFPYVFAHYFPSYQVGYLRLTHFIGQDKGSIEELRRNSKNFSAKERVLWSLTCAIMPAAM